jgi:histidinol-phosphate aminotransferase
MGLLDYYRQFEDMDEEEVNRGLRERRAREKALALQEVPSIDLSSTEWPDFPNSEVMNAAIFVARGRVNGYPDRHASRIRKALAERHSVAPEQIVLGNGASELLQTAAFVLLGQGAELVTPWPSYPLYPFMASRAGGRAVPVELPEGLTQPDALGAAIGDRTRIVVICNPNDPTGTYLESEALRELLERLPEDVHVLLDEALAHFQDVEDRDAAIRLLEEFPQLLVFRTFSKVYGLSGLRAGYVVGASAAGELLESLAPALGVNALTQAGVQHALKIGDAEIERRREMVIEQRARVLRALHDLPLDAPDSQANFVWLRAAGLSGAEVAGRLERSKVIVAAGGPLGADDHVRISIRGAAVTERLLTVLEEHFGGGRA